MGFSKRNLHQENALSFSKRNLNLKMLDSILSCWGVQFVCWAELYSEIVAKISVTNLWSIIEQQKHSCYSNLSISKVIHTLKNLRVHNLKNLTLLFINHLVQSSTAIGYCQWFFNVNFSLNNKQFSLRLMITHPFLYFDRKLLSKGMNRFADWHIWA